MLTNSKPLNYKVVSCISLSFLFALSNFYPLAIAETLVGDASGGTNSQRTAGFGSVTGGQSAALGSNSTTLGITSSTVG